jgi:TM2 domain-containing membrane protein YozV
MEVRSPKNRVLALVFCLFFGVFGIHRLYVGKFWTGLFQFFTAGGFGVWWIIDFVLILMGRFKDSEGRVLGPPQNTGRRTLPPAGRDGSTASSNDWNAKVDAQPGKDEEVQFDDDDLLADPLEKEFEKLEAEQKRRG